ncbi:MAG TPA: multiheme c-type cytochrome [Polyangiaceae bacterium]
MSLLRATIVVALVTGCHGARGRDGGDAGAAAVGADSGSAAVGATLYASPASRCGECHGAFEGQWRRSAHGHSQTTPAYLAMREHADAASCDGCHAPIDRLVPADDPARGDGVDCDACHTLSETTPRRSGGGFTLHIDDMTKYGPLCDAKNNYFHKVQCSPFHSQSEMCASCHWMATRVGSDDLPVFTEYEEWQSSRYGAIGVTCQDCHMPEESTAVAVGAKRRGGVAHHDFGADNPRFRSSALGLHASVEARAATVVVKASIRNENAGHDVPTGLPERRLVLRATTFDAGGHEVDKAERAYGRFLVDAAGEPAPFYAATRVASDTRILADETREESLELSLPAAGEVRLELVWQAMAPAIAAKFSLPTGDVVLQRGFVKVDKAAHGSGAALMVPVEVAP